MSDLLTSQQTTELAKETTKNENGSEVKSSIANFLIDFNVLQYTIAFVIALSIQEFLKRFMNFTVTRFIPQNKEYWQLISSLLTAIIVFVLAFIFVKYVFYKHIYTEDVEKERTIKKAITEKKTEAAIKKIEQKPDAAKVIEESVELNESFYGGNSNMWATW